MHSGVQAGSLFTQGEGAVQVDLVAAEEGWTFVSGFMIFIYFDQIKKKNTPK